MHQRRHSLKDVRVSAGKAELLRSARAAERQNREDFLLSELFSKKCEDFSYNAETSLQNTFLTTVGTWIRLTREY